MPSTFRRTRQILLSALLCLTASWASAQATAGPRSYAVLSELARDLHIITFQESTGTNLDANMRDRLPIPGGAIDRAALALTKAKLVALEPGARVSTFAPLGSDVFDSRQSFREGSDVGMPPDLRDVLRQQGTTHLVLLTRFSGEAQIQVRNAKIGGGRMEGVGFYIDNQTFIDGKEGVISARGFLAPFIYLRATLVDAATGRSVRTGVYTSSTAIPSSAGETSAHPWNALDDKGKVRIITELIDQGLAATLPTLLATP